MCLVAFICHQEFWHLTLLQTLEISSPLPRGHFIPPLNAQGCNSDMLVYRYQSDIFSFLAVYLHNPVLSEGLTLPQDVAMLCENKTPRSNLRGEEHFLGKVIRECNPS